MVVALVSLSGAANQLFSVLLIVLVSRTELIAPSTMVSINLLHQVCGIHVDQCLYAIFHSFCLVSYHN